MRGIIKDAAGVVKKSKDHAVGDTAILTAAQSIEHYQISRYGRLGRAPWPRAKSGEPLHFVAQLDLGRGQRGRLTTGSSSRPCRSRH